MLQKNRFEGDTELIVPPGEPRFFVTRTFNAPARLVWEAWTKPEYMRRWYGNSCMTLDVCEMDVRPGGAWRRVLRMADGKEIGFHGVYRELDYPNRIVFTEVFEPVPDHPSVVTVQLSERDGKTFVHLEQLHDSVQSRDMHIGSGMEQGMRETLDRLEQFFSQQPN
ncbi:MAG TPA: SRPBCC family protein [Polyangiaceae bacterium]|nr:SRPBCC family protein [Polyangiaceae bacterium]